MVEAVSWVSVGAAGWSARTDTGYAVFNNKMLIGGGTPINTEVWSSSDGSAWSEVDSTAFVARWGAAMAASATRVFVIGGKGGGLLCALTLCSPLADAYVSTNGVSFSLFTASVSWAARLYASAAFLGSDLYMLGGTTGTTGMDDVWRCTGGTCTAWSLVQSAAPYGNRHSVGLISLGGYLTLVGGMTGSTYYRDVWQSADGYTWNQITASAAFTARAGHAVVANLAAVKPKLYLMGGATSGSSYSNELWTSFDASTIRYGMPALLTERMPNV